MVLADHSVYGNQAGAVPEEQSHSLLPPPGEHRSIPCWHRLPPGMQPRARACHTHAALTPKPRKLHVGPAPSGSASLLWIYRPPLGLPAPSGSASPPATSLGRMGNELDAALPGVRPVRTHVLKGCRNSSASCPHFLLPAQIWMCWEKPSSTGSAANPVPSTPLLWWKQGFHGCNVPFPALQQQEKESTPKSEF